MLVYYLDNTDDMSTYATPSFFNLLNEFQYDFHTPSRT